ncbi:MAG: hypothetical protein ACOZDY_00695 [Pseudomonadota bacterium]
MDTNRVVIMIAIGLFLGGVVPHWFRRARSAREMESAAGAPAASAGRPAEPA